MENYRDTRKTMPAYTKRLFISWQQDAHTRANFQELGSKVMLWVLPVYLTLTDHYH
jgi:hypothetical protein